MMPSRPALRLALSMVGPPPLSYRGGWLGGPFQLQCLELLPAARVRLLQQRVPVLPHEVEQHVGDGDLLHLPADLRLGRQAHALLDLLEAGAALFVERDDLAVEDDLTGSQRPAHAVNLPVARGDVLATAAQELHDAAFHIRFGPDAVPLELEAPGTVWRGWLLDELGEHWLDPLGHRLAVGILRRIHTGDYPVFARGPETGGADLAVFF